MPSALRDELGRPDGRLRLGPPKLVFPTTSGMRVELCAADDGRLVILKYPRPGAPAIVADSLAAQGRQLQVLRSCCPESPFPPVLEATRQRLLLPYIPGVTLRDGRDLLGDTRRRRLLAAAVMTVFDLAVQRPAQLAVQRPAQLAVQRPAQLAGYGTAPSGSGFLAAELRRRLHRLESAVRELPRGPELRAVIAHADGGAVLHDLRHADRSGELDRIDGELAPARLGLGIHGDLTPQNIICGQAADGESKLTFIDPRGMVRWQGGVPWWDPVFDLAAAVVFDSAIDPISATDASRFDEPGRPGALAAGLEGTRVALVADCAADPRIEAWTGSDPRWLRRLDFAILARLLGNIAVQAEHGGRDGVGRAALVYAVTRLWHRRVWLENGAGL